MNITELPMEVQERLTKDRLQLVNKNRNDGYNVILYNTEGTRYFIARRCSMCWNDDKGNYMPFGGGTYWTIAYGVVQFRSFRNPVGMKDYELAEGKRYGKTGDVVIPSKVNTKKEVLEIARAIGKFDI